MMHCWDSLCSLLYLIAVMKKQKIDPGINNVVFIATVYALIKAPGFVSDPQQNQDPGWCRRIQMSDEVMSLSRCCGSAVLSVNKFVFLNLTAGLFLCNKWLRFHTLPVCFNFTVCPSVPETLNLWGQIRSQVRSSGTGLHSVSTFE